MFYLTKEDLMGAHNQPPFPSPHPSTLALSLPPFRVSTHIHTVIIKTHPPHAHAHTHTRSTCCHLLYVLSTILIEYIIHFTTIHHITFPQCHSLVLETGRERERERERWRTSMMKREKQRIRASSPFKRCTQRIRWGGPRSSVKVAMRLGRVGVH